MKRSSRGTFDYKEDIYRLHKADCRHVKKDPTETKGIRELEEEGGWLRFKTRRMARAFYQRNNHTLMEALLGL